MATHSSILAWEISGTEGAWWAPVYGVKKSQTWLNDSTPPPQQENVLVARDSRPGASVGWAW